MDLVQFLIPFSNCPIAFHLSSIPIQHRPEDCVDLGKRILPESTYLSLEALSGQTLRPAVYLAQASSSSFLPCKYRALPSPFNSKASFFCSSSSMGGRERSQATNWPSSM